MWTFTQINVCLLFGSIIYSNSYLECYKKHNSFELNKNVIWKTFDWNFRVLFWETYIWFDCKQRETCSETFFRTVFFLKTLTQKVTLDSWSIMSELINGNKNKRLYFCFNLWIKSKKKLALLENKKFGKGCFNPSEHTLYLKIFPPPNRGRRHY